MNIQERFEKLLALLKVGVYEKDTELGMSLLAALAGENVLLLGYKLATFNTKLNY